MSLGITSLIAFIVAIGVLVSVHEYGHYWVARRLGFKVLRYSIGFGRPLAMHVGRGPDRIEYVLAAIPLGGYVRLLDEREGPVPPGDAHRAFNRRPPLARIAVLLAGPAANFVFAAFAYWILFMQGVPGLRPVIGEVVAGSHAAAADLRPGDELLQVADASTGTRQAAVLGVLERIVEDGRVPLTVLRDGQEQRLEIVVPAAERRALTEPGTLLRGIGFWFWSPPVPAVAGELVAGGVAGAAGVQVGDRIVEVAGRAVADYAELLAAIRSRPGMETELLIERGASRLRLTLTPRVEMEQGKPVGKIGLGARAVGAADYPAHMHTIERYGPFAALGPAWARTWEMSARTVHFLWKMVTGDVSTKNISGPINIAQYAGLTASEGFIYYLGFLALVSISLAVLNLLPVPVLDGGQVAFQLAEMVKGSPLSMQAQVVGQRVGIAMLVALLGFAFYNDIMRLFG